MLTKLQLATCAVVNRGRAAADLLLLDLDEVETLAKCVNEDGQIESADAARAIDSVWDGYYERNKATDAEHDERAGQSSPPALEPAPAPAAPAAAPPAPPEPAPAERETVNEPAPAAATPAPEPAPAAEPDPFPA